jgi:phosphate transport system substrate-binding protein
MLIDTPGQNAYPIVATAFVLMRKDAPAAKTRHILNFLRWSLEKGVKEAADLGYVPLPHTLVTQIKDYWAKTLTSTKTGS